MTSPNIGFVVVGSGGDSVAGGDGHTCWCFLMTVLLLVALVTVLFGDGHKCWCC